MNFKKIILRQDDNKQFVQYEDPAGIVYKELTDDDFNALFEKLKFNDEYSLPDRMVQDYITDGSLTPSFKRGRFFDDRDMKRLVKDLRPYKKVKRLPKRQTNRKTKRNKTKQKKSKKRRH
jgi:hypothetical protein